MKATAERVRTSRYGGLDRDAVVAAVLRLARQHGIDAVTMRSLAAELGTSAPAVYYHVPNKQALLDLVAEALLREVRIPGPDSGSWQQRLIELYSSGRDTLLSVAGIATVLQSRPLSPAGRALDKAGLAIFREAGFDKVTARSAHALLYSYLLGAVSLEHALPSGKSRVAFQFGLRTIVAGLSQELAAP